MADPPKASSHPNYRGGKKIQITPSNTAHTAPRRAADMERCAPEASVNNPLEMSDFPSLSGAAEAPTAPSPQELPQNDIARAADPVDRILSYSSVSRKAVGLPVTSKSMIYMPGEVAKGMDPSALQQAIEENLALLAGLFASLPAELRNDSLQLSVPGHVDVAGANFCISQRSDPDFVPAFASKSSITRHLECIHYVLQNSMLKLSGQLDLDNLKTWLASIDCSPLAGSGATGFDFVRALSFSDVNRSAAHVSNQTWPVASSWADDLQLARMCTNLHYVEVELSLSDRFLGAIKDASSMEEAIRMMEAMTQPTTQLTRLLELKGLKVLRLRFFTKKWIPTPLDEEKKRMITSWLEEEFKAREQSVVVVPFGWWE
ncbi:hypothetical protein MBLNU13_g00558t1 [Cladosporium sp. NU13]